MNSIEPQDIVVFGVTGDLARTKLWPALYRIYIADSLPPEGNIVGAARRPYTDETFVELVRKSIEDDGVEIAEKAWQPFVDRLTYVTLDDDGYRRLGDYLQQKMRIFYLSLPPTAFSPVVRSLQEHEYNRNACIVVEKPFGIDLESAQGLNALLHEAFDEQHIYRLDHYLGKETVQNILVLRFGNTIFERLWNRDVVDHVEITVAESEGIDDRGSFYEETGALRDIVQNHALQMLSLLMMEPPVVAEAESIRDEKLKFLRAVHPVSPQDVTRGQYGPGVIDGEEVVGYREEPNVDPRSQTETFAALKLSVDNWRWAGVPIFLRTGKRLPKRQTEVEVAFKNVPMTFFEGQPVERLHHNHMTINIQPEESVSISIMAKAPGPKLHARPADLSFTYAEPNTRLKDAYEVLIAEAIKGDSTLFVRDDSIERAWEILEPVLKDLPPVHPYPAGSWGPVEAEELIAPYGWHIQ